MNPDAQQLHKNARKLPTPPSPAAYFEGCRRHHACSPDDVLLFSRVDAHELRRRSAESHLHRRFCLVNCLETAGAVSVDGIPFALKPGQAHLVFPQSYHHFLDLADPSILWLMLTFETDEPERLAPLRQHTLNLDAADRRDLGRMVSRFTDAADQGRGDFLSLTLSKMLCRLCERVEEHGRSDLPPRPFAGLWPRLQKELEALPPEELRIAPLAERLRISDRHLREKFKAQFGVQLGTYLRNYRIRRAIGLLTSTSLSLAEISDRCGYRSASSFHRAFIRHTGMKPADFRR
ncbi:helix-turn-helix transcriptional regulator [Haloferula sp. A504]|uniref:helix-turn-helix transcriptional regulator n=1 Tax=Haloferula sp. A504 TaxID=3373601 RepID=UPI0031C039A2|nr:helix-turn-helix transcriptional regulator [Verrucomicrobiaceae bacterium E54]